MKQFSDEKYFQCLFKRTDHLVYSPGPPKKKKKKFLPKKIFIITPKKLCFSIEKNVHTCSKD